MPSVESADLAPAGSLHASDRFTSDDAIVTIPEDLLCPLESLQFRVGSNHGHGYEWRRELVAAGNVDQCVLRE